MNNLHAKNQFALLLKKIKTHTEDEPQSIWLKSEFGATNWELTFSKELNFKIDFHILLSNNTYLSDAENSVLLNTFKQWLISSSSFKSYNNVSPTPHTAYMNTRITLHLIDYFILNDSELKISKYGLAILSETDLTSLVACLARSKHISEAVYKWSEKLQSHLKLMACNITADEVRYAIARRPSINLDLATNTTRNLTMSTSELVQARCWLFINGFYRKRSSGEQLYAYVLDTDKLTPFFYKNTLAGMYRKPGFNDFSLLPVERYHNEFAKVGNNSEYDSLRTDRGWRKYISCLNQLLQLPHTCSVPRAALQSMNDRNLGAIFETRPTGRTRTLPAEMAFLSLRQAIDFYLDYGEAILNDTAKYMISLKYHQANKVTATLFNSEFHTPSPNLKNVKYWSLVRMHLGTSLPLQTQGERTKSFFCDMRNNLGLYELLLVLYGCMIVVLGTLMARRQGELIDLKVEDSVEFDNELLVFYNRKSGAQGFRQKIKRPLPKIAIRMLESIISFQQKLLFANVITSTNRIFDLPDASGKRLLPATPVNYNTCLDRFCDYFQTPTNQNNERFYIRTHQLRRFFALMFFWGNAAGGMDTLRWFLAHTDIEHLYNYITEVTPGEALASAKASYVATQMRSHPEENQELQNLIRSMFGVENISILDIDETEEYLASIISNKKLTVEPIFYCDDSNKTYRIAIKVT